MDTELNDALEMMGAVYAPVVQFERPSEVLVDGADGYEVVKSLGWVKFSADFRKKMLRELKGAKLSVFICICLHINTDGTSFPGIEKMAEETGYDRDTVMSAIKEMEDIKGLLSVARQRGKSNKYRPYYVARGVKEPVQKIRPVGQPVQKSPTTFDETSPENLDSKESKRIKKSEAALSEQDLEQVNSKVDYMIGIAQQADVLLTACQTFEMALFGSPVNWPWSSNAKWQKFAKWCAEQDPSKFTEYAAWRKGDGKFHAMSNNKIRQDPQMFMDTGWPTFLAHSSMYGSNNRDKGFAL